MQSRGIVASARELELTAVPVDLRPCLPRMFEATGLAAGLPFRMRHCGTSFSGSWEMQATTNIMTLTGTAEVAGVSGTVSASGMVHDPSSRPYQMSLSGTVDFRIEETKDKHGMVIARQIFMRSDITRGGFVSTPLIGHPGAQAAFTQAMENPVTVINDNKPCNPDAPVYPRPPR